MFNVTAADSVNFIYQVHKSQKSNIQQPIVHIQYFVPDERKSGGAILDFNGIVRKIANGIIVTADDINICIEDVIVLDFATETEI